MVGQNHTKFGLAFNLSRKPLVESLAIAKDLYLVFSAVSL